jgi:putative transposase
VLPRRLRRLPGFSYCGIHQYSLVFSVFQRRVAFSDLATVRTCLSQIVRAAGDTAFVVVAYCFMPAHLHMVVSGTRDHASLPLFVHRAKQLSGYHANPYRRLWQAGYHDRVLRPYDDIAYFVAYVLDNPVRAGLVKFRADYPYSGMYPGVERRSGRLRDQSAP